jgi:hypothetical protein
MKPLTRLLLLSFAVTLCLVVLPTLPVDAQDTTARGEIKPTPWSGDWWSRKKGFLVKGWPGHSPSPFEKYDQYVLSRTGKNPGAWDWERNPRNNHYNPNAEQWEGHCNGWAAASILTPEPKHRRIRNGITFEVADQKGLLSEQYMNTYCQFYGSRYWGRPGDDLQDIYPHEFHRLLLEYLGTGKSALIVDISCDEQVWNFPAYKFESTWSSGWFNDKKLKVRTTVYFVDDNVRPEFIGTKWFSTTYTYNLFLDDRGNVVDGEWTGESRRNHPDFVWVPTADAPNPPGTLQENPLIDPRFVKEIVEGPERIESPAVTSNNPDSVVRESGLNPFNLF